MTHHSLWEQSARRPLATARAHSNFSRKNERSISNLSQLKKGSSTARFDTLPSSSQSKLKFNLAPTKNAFMMATQRLNLKTKRGGKKQKTGENSARGEMSRRDMREIKKMLGRSQRVQTSASKRSNSRGDKKKHARDIPSWMMLNQEEEMKLYKRKRNRDRSSGSALKQSTYEGSSIHKKRNTGSFSKQVRRSSEPKARDYKNYNNELKTKVKRESNLMSTTSVLGQTKLIPVSKDVLNQIKRSSSKRRGLNLN